MLLSDFRQSAHVAIFLDAGLGEVFLPTNRCIFALGNHLNETRTTVNQGLDRTGHRQFASGPLNCGLMVGKLAAHECKRQTHKETKSL